MKLRALLAFCALHLLLLGLAPGADRDEIVVASYNVQNYLGGERKGTNGRTAKAKPEKSVTALIQIIKEINPDILGVCEMGGPEQLEDFKTRLKNAGLEYVDAEYVEAADPERRLALLSRFPIVSRQSRTDISYELNGTPEKVKRGFLDVTVRVNPEYELRLVGVHLKSKLPVPQGEALMRRFEAQLLRKHLEKIIEADPQVNLLAYGDFNDTRNEPAIQEIMGVRGSPTHMADIRAADEHGDRWTHYWRTADQYARIDYFFASRALLPEVVKDKSYVYRSRFWHEASDHRPIYTSIVPVNRKR